MAKIEECFEKVCEKISEKVAVGYGISSPQAQELETALSGFEEAILQAGVFPADWTHKHSIGKGNLASVMWVVFLPPEQTTQDGIYVSCCFGKSGNGLVTGCAVSNTSKSKYAYVPTVSRKNPVVDVDGTRRGTHYNDGYVNPLEVLRGALDEVRFLTHLRESILQCQQCLVFDRGTVVSDSTKVRYGQWQAFLKKWPASKIGELTLENYTTFGGEYQSFCNWLEVHTDQLGSIWGGSSYKFGVFRANPKSQVVLDSTHEGDGTYKWYKRYGHCAAEVLAYVKKTFSAIASAASTGDLTEIDNVDFGHAVTWKVAFLYQSMKCPCMVPIYNKQMLCKLTEMPLSTPTSIMHAKLIAAKPAEVDIFDYYDELLERLPQDEDDDIKPSVPLKGCIKHADQLPADLGMIIQSFGEAVASVGLKYAPDLMKRFVCAQLAKPFVVLTGLSGSGKTKLAQAFTRWIGVENTYKVVPVGADWTNSEKLLGYPNALDPDKYVLPDTGVLKLMIDASQEENKDIPFFLILDEMNLSHVERYFADFLSAMESRETIKLYDGKLRTADDGTPIPQALEIPDNLFVIGTMNVDETTYMFSPKVLDRAQVIEFRVSPKEMSEFLSAPANPDMKALNEKGAEFATAFLELAKKRTEKKLGTDEEKLLHAVLVGSVPAGKDKPDGMFSALADLGAEFGYRSAIEIVTFVAYYLEASGYANLENGKAKEDCLKKAIDAAVLQKLLPKLHGSLNRLGPVLDALIGKVSKVKPQDNDPDAEPEVEKLYPLSHEKLTRMKDRVEKNGFTSFAEA